MAAPEEREGVETRGAGADRTLGDATRGDERNAGALGAERMLGEGIERTLGEGIERTLGEGIERTLGEGDEKLGERYVGGEGVRYVGVAAMLGCDRNDGGRDATLGAAGPLGPRPGAGEKVRGVGRSSGSAA